LARGGIGRVSAGRGDHPRCPPAEAVAALRSHAMRRSGAAALSREPDSGRRSATRAARGDGGGEREGAGVREGSAFFSLGDHTPAVRKRQNRATAVGAASTRLKSVATAKAAEAEVAGPAGGRSQLLHSPTSCAVTPLVTSASARGERGNRRSRPRGDAAG
jgi:hypothetical protein